MKQGQTSQTSQTDQKSQTRHLLGEGVGQSSPVNPHGGLSTGGEVR